MKATIWLAMAAAAAYLLWRGRAGQLALPQQTPPAPPASSAPPIFVDFAAPVSAQYPKGGQATTGQEYFKSPAQAGWFQ